MEQYRTWSDEALDEHRRAILCEQERRANLAAIPDQVRALAQTYREGGGDETALTDALAEQDAGEPADVPDETA